MNIFVTSRDPVKAALALDRSRVCRMAFEAYEGLCGALLLIRHGPKELPEPGEPTTPYLTRPYSRRHPLIKWLAADRWHARWTLEHAAAMAAEHAWRYGHSELCLPHRKCYDYLREHLHEIPTGRYRGRYDPTLIVFHGSFNHDWFRWEESFRPGTVLLDPRVSITSRYRLSMLHKWMYLDARTPSFGRRGPPEWAFKPVLRDWLDRYLGEPPRPNPELVRNHTVCR